MAKAGKQSEIDHRDRCIEEFYNNDKATELHQKDLDATNAKIEGLSNTIDVLASATEKGEEANARGGRARDF